MQVLVLVLNKVECLEKLLVSLSEAGIHGGTVIESTGMARVLGDSEDMDFLGTLRAFLDPHRKESKTLFFVLPDEQLLIARNVINQVVGGLDQPDTGIMFATNLSFVEGIGESLS